MSAPSVRRESDLELVGKLAIGLTTIAFAIGLIPLEIVMSAWAFRALWAWFVVPTLHVAPVTLATAAGLTLFARLIRSRSADDPKDAERTTGERLTRMTVRAVIVPVFFWLLGWCIQRAGVA